MNITRARTVHALAKSAQYLYGMNSKNQTVAVAQSDIVGAASPKEAVFAGGAMGDGAADDTAAVRAWLQAGGGYVPAGTYLIDPMTITNPVYVECAPGAVFKIRSPFTASATNEALILLNGGGTWIGGTFDGDRTNSMHDAYLAAMRGTSKLNVVRAYKAMLGVVAPSGDVAVNVQGVKAINHAGIGFYFAGSASLNNERFITGRIHGLTTDNCAYSTRIDVGKDLDIDDLTAHNTTNVQNGSNDQWVPTVCHIFHLIRLKNCKVGRVTINSALMRPSTWVDEGDSFVNGTTFSHCENTPIGELSVNGLLLTGGTASDTSGQDIGYLTSSLNISLVGNRRCPIESVLVQRSTASQGVEIIPSEHQVIGRAVLYGNNGRQGSGNGGAGINVHGRNRPYFERVATGEAKQEGWITIDEVKITGYHFGIIQRHSRLTINGGRIWGNRVDGITVGYWTSEGAAGFWGWPRASIPAGELQPPSLYLRDTDVILNGRMGIRLITGREVIITGGRISDNAQRHGYKDATLGGTSLTLTGQDAVKYDGGLTYSADTFERVVIDNVDMSQRTAGTVTAQGSYTDGAPAYNAALPDVVTVCKLVALRNPSNYERGQRITLVGVNTAQDENAVGWIVDWYGDLALVEVAVGTGYVDPTNSYQGAWDASVKAVGSSISGTWTYLNGVLTRATGTDGDAVTEVLGPCFIRADGISGYAYVMSVHQVNGVDTMYVLRSGDFGNPTGWPSSFTARTLEQIACNVTTHTDQNGTLPSQLGFTTSQTWVGRIVGQVAVDPSETSNGLQVKFVRSHGAFTLADDRAFYVEFAGAGTRGLLHLNGNTDAAGSGVFAFRVGDGNAFMRSMGSGGTGTITTGTGTLDGTTGTDTHLTLRADTASNRIYIENRRGASYTYTYLFAPLAGPASPTLNVGAPTLV